MRRIAQLSFICLLLLFSAALANDKGLTVKGVRFFSYTAFTRVVFEIETAAPYVLTKTADGRAVRFSAYEGSLTLPSALPAIHDSVISGIEQREEGGKLFLVIRLEAGAGDIKDFVLRGPDRIVLDVSKGAPPAPAAAVWKTGGDRAGRRARRQGHRNRDRAGTGKVVYCGPCGFSQENSPEGSAVQSDSDQGQGLDAFAR